MTRALIALLDAKRGVLRHAGVPEDDANEVLQDLIIQLLHGALARTSDLQNAEAWLTRVVRNAAHDFTRARKRRRTTLLDADEMARAIDEEARRLDEGREPDDDDEMATRVAALREAVALYAERARDRGRARQGAEQVWAWYLSQVRRLDGPRAQGEMAAQLGAAPPIPLLHRWASRGRELVRSLAAEDDEVERATLMARAAERTARKAA